MNQETEKTIKVGIDDNLKKEVTKIAKVYISIVVVVWFILLLVFVGFFYYFIWPEFKTIKQQSESMTEFQEQMLDTFGNLESVQQQGPEKVIELQEQFKEQGPEIWKNMFDMLQQGATEMQGR